MNKKKAVIIIVIVIMLWCVVPRLFQQLLKADSPAGAPPTVPATITITPTVEAVPPSYFEGRLFVRTYDAADREAIYAITVDPDTRVVSVDEFIPDLSKEYISKLSTELSADGRYYLANQGSRIMLYDLQTGKASAVLYEKAACFAWAPDNKKFTYLDEESHILYVYDLTSQTATQIYKAPSATYGVSTKLYGYMNCGMWTGTDSFVFNRFVGSMPSSVSMNQSELAANRTTLVDVSQPPQLWDYASRWYVEAVSADLSYALLRTEDAWYLTPLPLPASENLDLRQLTPFAGAQVSDGQFLLGSNQFCIAAAKDICQIYFSDPETLEFQPGPVVKAGWYPFSGEEIVVIGNPQDGVIAIHGPMGEVALYDLNTQQESTLLKIEPGGGFKFLGWRPALTSQPTATPGSAPADTTPVPQLQH